MRDIKKLEEKRLQVLEAIKPMCEAFGINDFDYIVKESGQAETLRLNETHISCSYNSISAIVDELIGYLFVNRWCRNRYLGAFSIQSQNVVKRYWVDKVTE